LRTRDRLVADPAVADPQVALLVLGQHDPAEVQRRHFFLPKLSFEGSNPAGSSFMLPSSLDMSGPPPTPAPGMPPGGSPGIPPGMPFMPLGCVGPLPFLPFFPF